MASRKKNRKREVKGRREEEKPPLLPLVVAIAIVIIGMTLGYLYTSGAFSKEEDGGSSRDVVDTGGGGENRAPSFVLISTDGKRVDSRDLAGKVVILDLMATWCEPCKYEITQLKEVRERYSENKVVIISVDIDPRESAQQLKEFKEAFGATWDFCTSNQNFRENYPAEAIPTLYILNKNFEIHQVYQGAKSSDQISAVIDELL